MNLLEEIRIVGEALCVPPNNSDYVPPPMFSNRTFCDSDEEDSIKVQIFAASAFLFLMTAAVLGNAVVMWIIYRHKVMHHGFNYFLFNMAFADLLIAVFNVGTSWTYNLYYDWWYGDLCNLTSFFGIAPTTVSVFSMVALSWDRCQAVVNPLRKRPLSRRRSIVAICIIWSISTITALPSAFSARVDIMYLYNTRYGSPSIRHVCNASAPFHFLDHMFFILQYMIPLAVLSFTFARIALAFRATDVATDNRNAANVTSHARAKSKAVKMLALMVVAFMFCWLPYHVYHTVMIDTFSMDAQTSKYVYLAIYWFAMSSTAFNPIIYCFANERFRIGFRFVFRWLPCVKCPKEEYEYSQLFPERLRSKAISLQLGRKVAIKPDSQQLLPTAKEMSSTGFSYHSTPDIVQCTRDTRRKIHETTIFMKNALRADNV